MKSKFSTQGGTDGLFNEPDTGFSNDDAAGDLNSTAMTGTNPVLNDSSAGTYITGGADYGSTTGGGMTTQKLHFR